MAPDLDSEFCIFFVKIKEYIKMISPFPPTFFCKDSQETLGKLNILFVTLRFKTHH